MIPIETKKSHKYLQQKLVSKCQNNRKKFVEKLNSFFQLALQVYFQ